MPSSLYTQLKGLTPLKSPRKIAGEPSWKRCSAIRTAELERLAAVDVAARGTPPAAAEDTLPAATKTAAQEASTEEDDAWPRCKPGLETTVHVEGILAFEAHLARCGVNQTRRVTANVDPAAELRASMDRQLAKVGKTPIG